MPDPTTVVLSPEGFSPTGFATVRGTAQGDSRVIVTADGVEVCAVDAAEPGEFDCGSVRLPDGAGIEIVVTETRAEPGAPVPAPASTSIDVLRPPVIDGPRELLTTGLISGTGRPGAAVTVSVDGSADAACSAVPVPASTYWSCNLSRSSGVYDMRAQQSDSAIANGTASGYSNVQSVTIDRDAPAAAVITSPAADARITGASTTATGFGESGARIDLYLDNVPACAATVVDGRWSCQVGGLSRGAHSLQAIMRDAAGNYAAPSSTVRMIVAAGAATAPSTTPTPSPSRPADPGTAPPQNDTAPPPDDGGALGPPPLPGPGPAQQYDWGSPTGFGGGIRSLADSVSTGGWYASPLIALVFLALVAIPLRLLATALRGRIALPRLTGRNRRRRAAMRTPADDARSPGPWARGPWARGVGAVAVAAALILASVGVAGEVRYLRLYVAIALGLAALNIVGGVVATRLGARANGILSTVRFLPLMLVAAAVTAVVSRMTDLEPPIIAGVLVGAAFASGTPVRRRAIVNLVQIGVVTALGVVAWMLLATVGPAGGFLAIVANEALATVCLAGLGSALVLVLPIASLPGRVVLEWSTPAWVVTTLVVSTVAAGVVFGGVLGSLALAPSLFAVAAFAALSLAVWGFLRFVEPSRA